MPDDPCPGWQQHVQNITPIPKWRGVWCFKHPVDLYLYQRLIQRTRPDTLVELGTFHGGSAVFFADSMTPFCASPLVVTVDKAAVMIPQDDRVRYIAGDLRSADTRDLVETTLAENGVLVVNGLLMSYKRRTMVVDDSEHDYATTMESLQLYAKMTAPGCPLVVEDTWSCDGAREAVEDFLAGCDGEFYRDEECNGFPGSYNQGGWMLRKE